MNHFLINILEQFKAISWVEWLGVLTGVLCVYLAVKENILNWPISIISVICYIYIFYHAKLYGDTLLQFYFLFTAAYGWYYWSYGKVNSIKSDRPISTLSKKSLLIYFVCVVFGSLLTGYLLKRFTDTDVPYIDSICTILSFTAQYLLTRKKIENWLIWILVDIIYIPLYVHKNLLATAILYFIFLFIAVKGYKDWNKKLVFNENKTT